MRKTINSTKIVIDWCTLDQNTQNKGSEYYDNRSA